MAHFVRHNQTQFKGARGRIELLPEGIVYIRIGHDGEVGATEVHDIVQCTEVLCRQQRPLILVDRMQQYWLSFEAQRILMEHTRFAAIAYWIRRPISRAMADFAMDTYYRDRPVRVFRYRHDAVAWLMTFQPTAPKMVPDAIDE